MLRSHYLLLLASASFLISTTIGFAQVNSATFSLFPVVRLITIFICGITLIATFAYRTPRREHFFSMVILVNLCWIALFQSGELFFEEFGLQRLFVSVVIILAGSFLLAFLGAEHKSHSINLFFQIYGVAVLAYIYITGGLTLLPVPTFNFVIVDSSGSALTYYQGISKFFGLAAIFSLCSVLRTSSLRLRGLLLVFLFLFMILSFIGGGRGDFVALIVVCFLVLFSSGFRATFYSALTGVVLVVFLVWGIFDFIFDTTAFMRFEAVVVDKNFGMRDILFSGAYNLLIDEPRCLAFGCGFAFFQDYYHYPYGYYPHNILLEALITWGIALMIPLLFFFAMGFQRSKLYLRDLFWIGVYAVLIGLKSGDIIESWLAMSFVIYVSASGMSTFFNRRAPR